MLYPRPVSYTHLDVYKRQIQGIYNEEGYQIVFVDTPGIHKPINKLGKVLNKQALSLPKDVDLILFVVEMCIRDRCYSYPIGYLIYQIGICC